MDLSIISAAFDGGASKFLDVLTGGSVGSDFGELIYFSLIYDFIRHEIKALGFSMMQRASYFAALAATAIVTMWVFYQGLRIMSGKGESMMALVMNASRVAFIVTAAVSMGVAGSAVYDTVGERLPNLITAYITDDTDTVQEQVDNSLAAMTFALKSIDIINTAQSNDLIVAKERALWMVAVGTAGPAVTAGALLLFYQAALALFVGLGPIFILFLIFDQTKAMFHRWLMYGIGTMFSMAVLAAMVSICLKAVIAVAAAHWVSAGAASLFDLNLGSGINSIAMQQGGLGMLMTLLIITVPPMAANFFQGTLGQFAPYNQVDGGGARGGGGDQRSRYESASQNVANTQQREMSSASTTGRNPGAAPSQATPVTANVGPQGVTGASQTTGASRDVLKTTSPSGNPTATPSSNPQGQLISDNRRGTTSGSEGTA